MSRAEYKKRSAKHLEDTYEPKDENGWQSMLDFFRKSKDHEVLRHRVTALKIVELENDWRV